MVLPDMFHWQKYLTVLLQTLAAFPAAKGATLATVPLGDASLGRRSAWATLRLGDAPLPADCSAIPPMPPALAAY
jgi:hypothetical protein